MGYASRSNITEKQAIQEIGDIEERYCKDCPIKKEFRKKPRNEQEMTEYCFSECKYGKRIRALGGILEYGTLANSHFIAPELTKEVYIEMRDKENKSDRQIRDHFGMSRATLLRRKTAWGLHNKKRYIIPSLVLKDLTKEELEDLSKRYSDMKIAKMLGVCAKTIGNRRKQWGIPRESYLIKNNFTLSEYKYLKSRGMVDREIAELWEISSSSVLELKREWGLIPTNKRINNHKELEANGLTKERLAELALVYTDEEIAKQYNSFKTTIREYRRSLKIRGKSNKGGNRQKTG